MRCRDVVLALVVGAALGCADGGGASDRWTVPVPTQPEPQPATPSLPAAPEGGQVTTNTVVLSFLTSGEADTTLRNGQEEIVQQFDVYAPCHPQFNSMPAVWIRPVIGCPLPYNVWETELDVAPATVMNPSATPVLLTATVYSDNLYVYQQQQTVQPGSRAVVSFGSLQLGYICTDGYPMPITVSLRASGADMVLMRSTSDPAGARAPKFPDYPKVWGSVVVLSPLDGESGVCVIPP
jgi:hypothetical protein